MGSKILFLLFFNMDYSRKSTPFRLKDQSLGKNDNYSIKLYSSLIDKLTNLFLEGLVILNLLYGLKQIHSKYKYLCDWLSKINFLYVTFILDASYHKQSNTDFHFVQQSGRLQIICYFIILVLGNYRQNSYNIGEYVGAPIIL